MKLTSQMPSSTSLMPTARQAKLGNQRYCYPLTVTDHASRYLLLWRATMPSWFNRSSFSTLRVSFFQIRLLPSGSPSL